MKTTPKSAEQFNQEYLAVHQKKENLFWTTYMGVEKDHKLLEEAESRYKSYISDPAHIAEVRDSLKQSHLLQLDDESKIALEGWQKFFAVNSIENEHARALQLELIEMERKLFEKRAKADQSFKDEKGETKQGSLSILMSNINASDNETTRRTSHEALMRMEKYVLESGYLDVVRKRNEFARALGHKNFFEFRCQLNESMSAEELFTILGEFEEMTRESCFNHQKKLAQTKGADAVLPHNFKFASAGSAERELDPYLSFSKSLEIWTQSFERLGVRYRNATLHLDLFERKGKYENGFMHGPSPTTLFKGKWSPARINFTSNATPNQMGSGKRGLVTLFHEGGHAAHFANITMPGACFSMEYPPTSMAYAETQSMFLDSIASDGDWLKRYGINRAGQKMPDEVIRSFISLGHPMEAFQERQILVVPYFESELYSLNDQELTPENALKIARRVEKKILGLEASPRPVMAVPHLLSYESACSYQGYLLANMAVYQTRDYFLKKYGFLTDNPKIGADLEKYYWLQGNRLSHKETVKNLTGLTLSGKALADHCNLNEESLWDKTRALMLESEKRPSAPVRGDLEAEIHIVHGAEEIANNLQGSQKMCEDFEKWVARMYPMGG